MLVTGSPATSASFSGCCRMNQAERPGRNVPLPLRYGRVLEHVDLSIAAELQEIVARLGARRPSS